MSSKATTSNSNICLSALTDVGRARDHNEDNFVVCPDLEQNEWYLDEKPFSLSQSGCVLVVADGMGGANAGEVASQIAVDSIKNYFSGIDSNNQLTEKQEIEHLQKSILNAHEAIVDHAAIHPDCEGMGTTIVIAWVKPFKAVIAWCGDSRGYLYRPGEGLMLLTKDHSLVWEMVEAGKLTLREADVHPNSNIITQSLGDPNNPPKPDIIVKPLQSADKLLLCSDGLNNMVDMDDIENSISSDRSLKDINLNLVETANQHGGKDNVTVVSVEIKYDDLPAPVKGKDKVLYNSIFASILFVGFLLIALAVWINKGYSDSEKQKTFHVKAEKHIEADQTKDTIELNDKSVEIRIISDKSNPEEGAIKAKAVRQMQSTSEEASNTNPGHIIEEVDERITRINEIVVERNEINLDTDTLIRAAVNDEEKFYEEEEKRKRFEREKLIKELDEIIFRNEWQIFGSLDSTQTYKLELLKKDLLLKWPDLTKLDIQIDSAEANLIKLKQLQMDIAN